MSKKYIKKKQKTMKTLKNSSFLILQLNNLYISNSILVWKKKQKEQSFVWKLWKCLIFESRNGRAESDTWKYATRLENAAFSDEDTQLRDAHSGREDRDDDDDHSVRRWWWKKSSSKTWRFRDHAWPFGRQINWFFSNVLMIADWWLNRFCFVNIERNLFYLICIIYVEHVR